MLCFINVTMVEALKAYVSKGGRGGCPPPVPSDSYSGPPLPEGFQNWENFGNCLIKMQ